MNFNSKDKFTPEFTPSQVKFQSDPDKYIKNLNPTQIATVNVLIKVSNIYGYIYPGQKRIADRAGVSVKTVNTYLKMLHDDGLLYKKYNHRHTCDYYLHPVFFEKWFRKKFSNLINCLNWVPLIILLSATISSHVFGHMNYEDNHRPLNKRNLFKKPNTKDPSVNQRSYRREGLTNVRNNKVALGVTNRKGSLSNVCSLNKESSMLKRLAIELSLGNYELKELGVFSEDVLKHGYLVLQKSPHITNKFKYLMKVCSNIQARRAGKTQAKMGNGSAQQSGGMVKDEVPEERKTNWNKQHTAEQIANELVKINDIDSTKMHGGEGYKQRMLCEWSDKDYVSTGDEHESLALRIIDKYRIMVGLIPRNMPELQPGSIETKENDKEHGNTLNGADSLSNVKFGGDCKLIDRDVNYLDLEEVLDDEGIHNIW